MPKTTNKPARKSKKSFEVLAKESKFRYGAFPTFELAQAYAAQLKKKHGFDFVIQ